MSMSVANDIEPTERERLRVDFYRAYRPQPGLNSVAIRRGAARGVWFLDVGATGPVAVPSSYRGLAVQVKPAAGAINAVAGSASVRPA